MSLEQLSKTVDFVQDATPSASDANDGETYLDTSQSPPQLKVFDSSANAFVRPRSVQNLDAPVSGAGATQTDIETGVDNSNTGATVLSNLDAPVSAAGADLRFIGGFQLSLASFLGTSFDVSGQAGAPRDVAFNGDGTSMFVVDDRSGSVLQYSLSTGFDLSSASFSGTSFDVSGQGVTPEGVAFSGDGTSMFVIQRGSASVFQYSLSTGFDLSSASFSGTSFDVSGQEDSPQGVAFNGDGTSMFVIGFSSDSVFQYSLSTGFDLSSASFSGTSFDVSGQDTFPRGVAFSGDGTSMFVIGTSSNPVFQYSLSTGFDLSSASFSGTSFDVSGQAGSSTDVAFSGDGTSMFVVDDSSGSVFQYFIGEVGPK